MKFIDPSELGQLQFAIRAGRRAMGPAFDGLGRSGKVVKPSVQFDLAAQAIRISAQPGAHGAQE